MILDNFFVCCFSFLWGSLPLKFFADKFAHRRGSWRLTSGSFDTARVHLIVDPWLANLITVGDIFKAVLFAKFASNYFDSYFPMIFAVLLFLMGHISVYLLLVRRANIILPLLGLWLVYLPQAVFIFLLFYLITIIFFKYLKIALVLNVLIFPLIVYFITDNLSLVILALLQLILILVLYIPSIQRFFSGQEKSYLEQLEKKIKKIK